MELSLFTLIGRAAPGDVVWSVCALSTILGSLSADGWGCVPVFLVAYCEVSSTEASRPLGRARSSCRYGYSLSLGGVQWPQLGCGRNTCGGRDWQAVATDWDVLALVGVPSMPLNSRPHLLWGHPGRRAPHPPSLCSIHTANSCHLPRGSLPLHTSPPGPCQNRAFPISGKDTQS